MDSAVRGVEPGVLLLTPVEAGTSTAWGGEIGLGFRAMDDDQIDTVAYAVSNADLTVEQALQALNA